MLGANAYIVLLRRLVSSTLESVDVHQTLVHKLVDEAVVAEHDALHAAQERAAPRVRHVGALVLYQTRYHHASLRLLAAKKCRAFRYLRNDEKQLEMSRNTINRSWW